MTKGEKTKVVIAILILMIVAIAYLVRATLMHSPNTPLAFVAMFVILFGVYVLIKIRRGHYEKDASVKRHVESSVVLDLEIPLRIRNISFSNITMIIPLVGGLAAGGVVCGLLVRSDSEWANGLGEFIFFIVGLTVIISVWNGMVEIIDWLRGTPRWFEFSDHFAYASRRTVHDLQWCEVKSIAFSYEQGYVDPDSPADYEPGEHTYTTFLEVSFAGERTLRIAADEGCKASLHAERIVQMLVHGLASTDPVIRKRCAEGLGQMSVSAEPWGKHGGSIRAIMGRFVWDDATGVVERLRRAESDLRTAAADQDEGVRRAATAALKRITSP